MKEHFQDYGVRKWAGDDLIELQAESLEAIQSLVTPYAPCIIQGCEVSSSGSEYNVSPGLVALPGNDATGKSCVKIVRFGGLVSTSLPVYLMLHCETISRVYSDGKSKAIAYDYTARATNILPVDEPYLEIGGAGVNRLVDKMGITQKLDRDGGEAKDVTVTFAQASSRTLPASGSKLGILMGSIRKWLYDLKALAFKDKVAGSDLDADVVDIINKKVDKKAGYALSKNDFTDALLDKLNGIAANANNYALPLASSTSRGGVKTGYPETANNRAVKLSSEKAYVNIPNASSSVTGLMSATDKAKLDGIAEGANKTTVDSALSSTSTNPVQNKVIKEELDGLAPVFLNMSLMNGGTIGADDLAKLKEPESGRPLFFGNFSDSTNQCLSATYNWNGTKLYVQLIEPQPGDFRMTSITYSSSGVWESKKNIVLDFSGDGTKFLNDKGVYAAVPGPHVVAHGMVSADGTVTFYYGEGRKMSHTTGIYRFMVTGGLMGRILLAFPMQDGFYLSQAALSGGTHTITAYKNGTKTDCDFCFIVYAMN